MVLYIKQYQRMRLKHVELMHPERLQRQAHLDDKLEDVAWTV